MKKKWIAILACGASLIGCSEVNSPVAETEQAKGSMGSVSEVLLEGDMLFYVDTTAKETSKEQGALGKKGVSLLQPPLTLGSPRVTIDTWRIDEVINYNFDVNFSGTNALTDQQKNEFRRALKDISNQVRISFQEVPTNAGARTVSIRSFPNEIPGRPSSTCGLAAVGYTFDNKNFAHFASCGKNYRTFAHEMLHVLGFVHEHQRADRDENVIQVNGTGLDYDVWEGNTYNAPYDPSSIMNYQATPNEGTIQLVSNNPAHLWIGVIPLMSLSDKQGMKTEYGSEAISKNLMYMQNAYTRKYLCFTSSGQVTIQSSKTGSGYDCKVDLMTGYASIEARYGGAAAMYWTAAPKVRNTVPSNPSGFYSYLDITKNSSGVFSFGSAIQGDANYASSVVPLTHAKSGVFDGSIMLWSPLGACIGVNSSGALNGIALTEAQVRGSVNLQSSHASCFWKLSPAWDPTVPY